MTIHTDLVLENGCSWVNPQDYYTERALREDTLEIAILNVG